MEKFEFNIETIVSIRMIQRKESDNYVWTEKKLITKKYFFGLFKKEYTIDEGWYSTEYELGERSITEEKLKSYNYIIEKNKLYSRSFIEIKLLNGDRRTYAYNSDEDAKDFMEHVKKESNKTFI